MKVIGHRGASSSAPENTMASFRAAIELGVDGIEFDVQQTADGRLVVIHDAMLDRTTNGTGHVFETSAAAVGALDAGGWFSKAFAGARVPRLDDVLALHDVDFELEFKDYGRALLDSVLDAVDRAGVFSRVKFTGWNFPLLGILRSERPQARIGLFSTPRQPWMTASAYERYVLGMAETSPADVAHVYAGGITPRIVEGLHGLGLEAHANDAADSDEMKRAIDAGVDSLSANDVRAAVLTRDSYKD